jgi:hypothetical protein
MGAVLADHSSSGLGREEIYKIGFGDFHSDGSFFMRVSRTGELP